MALLQGKLDLSLTCFTQCHACQKPMRPSLKATSIIAADFNLKVRKVPNLGCFSKWETPEMAFPVGSPLKPPNKWFTLFSTPHPQVLTFPFLSNWTRVAKLLPKIGKSNQAFSSRSKPSDEKARKRVALRTGVLGSKEAGH